MIDLSGNVKLSVYAEIVREIRAVSGTDFFLCGATARDILLEHVHGVPTTRATLDVDFGVMVCSLDELFEIRRALEATGRFSIQNSMTRIRYGTLPVDLIPFGGIEDERRTVTWPPGDSELNTLGFQEALACTVEVNLPANTKVQVASLPTQAMLKVIAWGDRNPRRGSRDAQDFRIIAKSYHRVVGEERLYAQSSLFERNDFDVERAGAWILGHDVHSQMHVNGTIVLDRVNQITTQQAAEHGDLLLVSSMGGPVDENLQLLKWFSGGLSNDPEHF